ESAPRTGLVRPPGRLLRSAGSLLAQGIRPISVAGSDGVPEGSRGASRGSESLETQRQDTPLCWISAGQNPYLRVRRRAPARPRYRRTAVNKAEIVEALQARLG